MVEIVPALPKHETIQYPSRSKSILYSLTEKLAPSIFLFTS